MDYLFGFNGQEKLDEINGAGNDLDFGARVYDARLGRWMSIDPFNTFYPSHSGYSYALLNPICFIDFGGNYIIDEKGNIVKFKIKKDGTVKFKGSPDPFTRKVVESMAANSEARSTLIKVSEDKNIKVRYREMTAQEAKLIQEIDNVTSKGVTLTAKEEKLLSEQALGTSNLSLEEFRVKKNEIFFEQNILLSDGAKGTSENIFIKDPNAYKSQVVLINMAEINKDFIPDREFLLTASEESMHSMQSYIQLPRENQDPWSTKHEEEVKPLLERISKSYDETHKTQNPDPTKEP
jgi:RHS repeat-associated protein